MSAVDRQSNLSPVASYELCVLLQVSSSPSLSSGTCRKVVYARVAVRLRGKSALSHALLLGFTCSSTRRAPVLVPSSQAPSCRRYSTIASPFAMFGIGPMLPLTPAAGNCDRFCKKVQKRKSKRNSSAESHEPTIMRRPSTIKPESTLFKDNGEYAVQQRSHTPHHQRDLSLIVDFDLDHAAAQLKDGEISDLELALFAFWIRAKHDNYLMAKGLVRELGLDQVSVFRPSHAPTFHSQEQGYNVDKITNSRVRKLLQEVHDVRPRSVPRKDTSSISVDSGASHRDIFVDSIQSSTLVKAGRRVWFAAAGGSSKTCSNKFTVEIRDMPRPWKPHSRIRHVVQG